MAFQSIPGGFFRLGPREIEDFAGLISTGQMSAAGNAVQYIGRVVTADGGSHTLDATGSSSLGWRAESVTFASASTSVSVGLATVDLTTGPAARAVNSAGTITFDVVAVIPGAAGGITANSWQTSVPTTGSKTIANGDLVAFAAQMTARGGSDLVQLSHCILAVPTINRPVVTHPTNTAQLALPNVIITFSDGTLGWIEGSDILNTMTARTWNSGSATKEYGQLYQMPFPMQVCGIYGQTTGAVDRDIVLYSDPLGTPVAERTASIDANATGTAVKSLFYEFFSSPYAVAANQPIGAVIKPGASSVATTFKTLQSAAHRVTDPWGTSGFGISRASGAFANANSSLDHYYVGLLVNAFDDGSTPVGRANLYQRGTPF